MSTFHVRRPGEYQRSLQRVRLHDLAPDDGWDYERWMRGTPFHEYAFAGRDEGERVDLELVPEPFNAHDATAVAVDFGGRRIGYLPESDAVCWHDIIRAVNRSGASVWLRGRLTAAYYPELPEQSPACRHLKPASGRVEVDALDAGWDDQDDEDLSATLLVPVIELPSREDIAPSATAAGLGAVVAEIFQKVGPSVFEQLLDHAWDGLTPELVDQVARYADHYPELTWPTHPRGSTPARRDVPWLLYMFLRNEVYARRRAAAAQRAQERAARAARRRAEDLERAHLLEDVQTLSSEGASNTEIAAKLALSGSRLGWVHRHLREGKLEELRAQLAREDEAKHPLLRQLHDAMQRVLAQPAVLAVEHGGRRMAARDPGPAGLQQGVEIRGCSDAPVRIVMAADPAELAAVNGDVPRDAGSSGSGLTMGERGPRELVTDRDVWFVVPVPGIDDATPAPQA